MDGRSETVLALVMPELAGLVRAADYDFQAQTGSYIEVIQGYRTYAYQDQLYFSSRPPNNGPWKTNARGGYSNHNTGMAVDCVPAKLGSAAFLPDWDSADPLYKTMVACMKKQGLAWGGDWSGKLGDFDHFQLANVPVTPTDSDRVTLARGGVSLLWATYRQTMHQPVIHLA